MSNLKNYYLELTREQKQGLTDLETSLVYFRLQLKVTSETTVTPKGQKLEAGQCVTGLRTLADECRISFKQVRTILRNLENLELIKVDSRSIGSIITILSYRTAKASVKKTPIKKINKSFNSDTSKSVDDRIQDFKDKVYPFIIKYGKPLCKEFSDWYTEVDDKGRLRIEDKKYQYFEVSRRLATWAKRQQEKDAPKITKADDHLTQHIKNQLKKGGNNE